MTDEVKEVCGREPSAFWRKKDHRAWDICKQKTLILKNAVNDLDEFDKNNDTTDKEKHGIAIIVGGVVLFFITILLIHSKK